MAPITDEEYRIATERGNQKTAEGLWAISAQYDPLAGLIYVKLANGQNFDFAPRQFTDFAKVSDAIIAEVKPIALGTGLRWESLDEDYSVEGLYADYLEKQKLAGVAAQ